MEHMSNKELISTALRQWANYIETGNVSMSKKDAVNCGQKGDIKILSTSQVNMVERLRDLANKELSSSKVEPLPPIRDELKSLRDSIDSLINDLDKNLGAPWSTVTIP